MPDKYILIFDLLFFNFLTNTTFYFFFFYEIRVYRVGEADFTLVSNEPFLFRLPRNKEYKHVNYIQAYATTAG